LFGTREKMGVTEIRIIPYLDEPNHLIAVFEALNRDSMRKIEFDPRLQERFSDKSIFVEPPKIIGEYHIVYF